MRVNGIAPAARTRLTESTPGLGDIVKAPDDPGRFDVWDPANVSPLVAWLATEACPANGRVFFVQGGHGQGHDGLDHGRRASSATDRWTVAELDQELRELVS